MSITLIRVDEGAKLNLSLLVCYLLVRVKVIWHLGQDAYAGITVSIEMADHVTVTSDPATSR